MKEIAEATAKLSNKEIAELEQNGIFILNLPGGEVQLTTDDVEIITEDMPGWLTANEGKLTVALDITVTDELLKEGIARELVNRIQNIRKQNGYEITDRITVEIEKRDEINDAVTEFSNYISSQTLAAGISLVDKLEDGIELDFDEYMVKVKVEKTR